MTLSLRSLTLVPLAEMQNGQEADLFALLCAKEELTTRDGNQHAGHDLQAIVQQARNIVSAIDNLNTRYNRSLVEQAAIVGGLDPEGLSDPARIGEVMSRVAAEFSRTAFADCKRARR